MKLTQEHIGKKVRQTDWDKGFWVKLDFLSTQNYAVAGDDRHGRSYYGANGAFYMNWELYEEEKKPSDRIREIACPMSVGDPSSEACMIGSIVQYLDEEWQKRKG